MVRRVRTIRRLVLDLPGQARLAYCLTRDPRTPRPLKLAAAAAIAAILTPAINLPLWVPVVGEMDAVTLLVVALRRYNASAPPAIRQELETQLQARTSVFDRDLAAGGRAAQALASWIGERAPGPIRRRPRPAPPPSGPPAADPPPKPAADRGDDLP